MTLEEAIKNREDCLKYLEGIGRKASPECMEAVRWSVKALKALRPVSREQVEKVWTGCPACKNGPLKLHIPAFRAMAICNQHMDHEAFDIELNGIFCLNCGRPLTPKAWEELKKRWEALNDGKGD
jgi:carbonic anhydrase